ncbi:hypothetical protein LSH36_709g01030 [Paralvinella palmiformis]|uniref:Aminoacyl-transfer RNA synthetases class-II family profile domain-containing protein n=1 Tax=Paralvinella palmiformis TaxID=53620 RepID=A0AAD9MVY9_9ANNE|nr:hypothetical protein LSH36_709g01030 [Paralvinella palmiformis]
MFRSIRVEGSFLRDWNYEASVEASGDAVVFHYICIDRGEAAAQFEELPLVKYSDDPPSRTKKVLCLRFLMQFSFLSEFDQVSLISMTKRTHHCGELRVSDVGKEVTLCGWLQYLRMDGQFIVIKDAHGTTQITVPQHSESNIRDVVNHMPLESVIEVIGIVEKRPDAQDNKNMPTGDVEVIAKDVKLLNPCRKDLPFHTHDFHKVDVIQFNNSGSNSFPQNISIFVNVVDLGHGKRIPENGIPISGSATHSDAEKSQVKIKCDNEDERSTCVTCTVSFVDVETPTLFRRTPGGAREFVVPTHTPGKYYCLPQSPQQFKQLLMVGGIDRYMQIARCYRDEQAKPDRQPEFTQLDIEMSFVNQEDIKRLIEDLLEYCWPDHLPPIERPFPRMTYGQAIAQYGIDKPDTRFDMKLQDITPMLSKLNSTHLFWLSQAVDHYPMTSVQAVNCTQAATHLSNKDLKELNDVAGVFVKDKPEAPSLKCYDDEIPCKQANLLDTDLLVLDVIDDFELSVAVVNACIYYIAGYILSNFKQFTDLD